MGMKTLIAKQIQSGMKILGTDNDGLYSKHTYIKVGEGSYDPETRRVSASETRHADIPMTLVRFSIDDMDDDVRPKTDRKALIASLDLPVDPGAEDKIEMRNGIVYTVMKVLKDPSEGLCILHIRME